MDKDRRIDLRKMPYEEYLKTPEWAALRKQALERDGHRCRACNSDDHLHVHHRTYARRGYEDMNDLTTLCESCHEHFHKKIDQADIMARTYMPPREEKRDPTAWKWEDFLVGVLVQHEDLLPEVVGITWAEDFSQEDARGIYTLLHSRYIGGVQSELQIPTELQPAVDRCIAEAEFRLGANGTPDLIEIMRCVVQVKKFHLLERNKELRYLLLQAAESKDTETLRKYQQELLAVHQQLRTINTASYLRTNI